MSVFGVDFGSRYSVIGTARHGGIDIICNEVSKRETSSFVSLGDDNRFIGESGLDKSVKASTNTVSNVKRFIGLRDDDAGRKILEYEKKFNYVPTSYDKDGKLVFDMNVDGESVELYPEQILGMLMGQFRKYVSIETKTPIEAVRDCVVTVPVWYTVEQRKLVQQASEAAGLNCMTVVNETTAALVDYGIFRGSELPEKEEDAQHIALVDTGYACTTVTIGKFWRGHVRVLAHAYDEYLGTRELDYSLLQYFAAEIKKKYKIDVLTEKRATLRVLQACDKVKVMLSANSIAPLNIECIMDVDVAFNQFNRSQMEEAVQPLVERLKAICQRAVDMANIDKNKIEFVELIGGGCRIPIFKAAVGSVFEGKQTRFTLNASESIAKGATIMAAVVSPLFQVREFVIFEKPMLPVCVGFFDPAAVEGESVTSSVSFLPGQVNKVVTVLRENDCYPKVFDLTLYMDQGKPFDLFVFYDEEAASTKRLIPQGGKRLLLGKYQVGGSNGKKTNGEVMVRVRFAHGGNVTVESAWTTEKYEVEEIEQRKKDAAKKEAAPAPAPAPAAGSEDAAASGEGEKTKEATDAEAEKKATDEPVRIKKEKTRRLELALSPVIGVIGHHPDLVSKFVKTESELVKRDETILKTKDARNSLESYIFDNRGGVSEPRNGSLGEYMTQADRDAFLQMCSTFEAWLEGEEGYSAKYEELTSRLEKMRVIGAPAFARKKNIEDLSFHHNEFAKQLQELWKTAVNKKGKEAHITDEEINAILAKLDEEGAAMKNAVAEQLAADKTKDAKVTKATLDAKLKEMTSATKAVVNKKAPPPPPPPKKEEPVAAAAGADAAAKDDAAKQPEEGEGEKKATTEDGSAPDAGPKVDNDMD